MGRTRIHRTRPARTAPPYAVFLLAMACVRWQSVPHERISERPLPRWVQVTTRDSAHYTLERARVAAGDTLIGRPEGAASDVRLPLAEVAHLEARVPSGTGSIGVGLAVIAGLMAMIVMVAHA